MTNKTAHIYSSFTAFGLRLQVFTMSQQAPPPIETSGNGGARRTPVGIVPATGAKHQEASPTSADFPTSPPSLCESTSQAPSTPKSNSGYIHPQTPLPSQFTSRSFEFQFDKTPPKLPEEGQLEEYTPRRADRDGKKVFGSLASSSEAVEETLERQREQSPGGTNGEVNLLFTSQ